MLLTPTKWSEIHRFAFSLDLRDFLTTQERFLENKTGLSRSLRPGTGNHGRAAPERCEPAAEDIKEPEHAAHERHPDVQNCARRRASFFSQPNVRSFLAVRVQKSRVISD